MYGWNLFLVLFTNGSFFIHFEWCKEKAYISFFFFLRNAYISKSITYIRRRKKNKILITLEKCNFSNKLDQNDWTGLKWTEMTELDQMDQNGTNCIKMLY